MNRILILVSISLFISSLTWSCSNGNDGAGNSHYKIVSEEKKETPGKAQFIEYALYNDSLYTEEALQKTIMDIYNLKRDEGVFDNHDETTIRGIYLFTSQDAMVDKDNWIAMLFKHKDDIDPTITFQKDKIAGLNTLQNSEITQDKLELEDLEKHLAKRGLDLCSFAAYLRLIENENLRKVDAMANADNSLETLDALDAQSNKLIRKKYNVSEDILRKVSTYATIYCK